MQYYGILSLTQKKERVSGSQWYLYAIASYDDDLFLETFLPIVLPFIF